MRAQGQTPSREEITRGWKSLQKQIGLSDPRQLQVGTLLPGISPSISPQGEFQKAMSNAPQTSFPQKPSATPQYFGLGKGMFAGLPEGNNTFENKSPLKTNENMRKALRLLNTTSGSQKAPNDYEKDKTRLSLAPVAPPPPQSAPGPELLGKTKTPRSAKTAKDSTRFLYPDEPLNPSPGDIYEFANGGEVRGGIPGVDSVNIKAQQGEYVLPTEIVNNIKDGKPVSSVKAVDEMQRMYEEWQPQTDEGKRYRKELGQVIAQQANPVPMMKHGGGVKKKGYGY